MSIVSILAVAALVAINPVAQFQKANDARRKSDLSQIQNALEVYYQDNGRYPLSTGNPYYCLQHFVSPYPYYCGGSSWTPYMNVVPKDPKTGYSYVYYSSDEQSYYLYASLERGVIDPQACKGLISNECPNKPFATANACGGPCNYGISSPNVSP